MAAADAAEGNLPCGIVATVGATATTAIDPVAEIAAVARRCGAWLHVDAAMAGSAMILPECRWMWDGIEGADSLVVNAHKWLGAPFDCSLYYVRDPQHLMRVMSTNPSYLRSAADRQVMNCAIGAFLWDAASGLSSFLVLIRGRAWPACRGGFNGISRTHAA